MKVRAGSQAGGLQNSSQCLLNEAALSSDTPRRNLGAGFLYLQNTGDGCSPGLFQGALPRLPHEPWGVCKGPPVSQNLKLRGQDWSLLTLLCSTV